MKKSIAKRVTIRVSAILVIALAILFVSSYLLVQNIIYSKAKSYANAVLTVYTDLITQDVEKLNIPINEQYSDLFLKHGDYICKWYNVDFAYLFVPDVETGKIRYICVTFNL